jgi:hypothetical protein
VRSSPRRDHRQRHIRANVYVDKELALSPRPTRRASPITGTTRRVLHGSRLSRLPHEQIIAKLDQSAQVFRILIVKTDMTIPYTSVFFELDCGYWNADAEAAAPPGDAAADLK